MTNNNRKKRISISSIIYIFIIIGSLFIIVTEKTSRLNIILSIISIAISSAGLVRNYRVSTREKE